MIGLDVPLAFSAGLLATLNPCGWAMLPSFIIFYLGADRSGYEQKPLVARVGDGLFLGLLVTLGFLAVFSVMGMVMSAGLRFLSRYLPLLTILVGILLVLLGIWLLMGKSLPISLPAFQGDVKSRSPKSAFLFGVAYGTASLSCTLPVFLIVVATTLVSDSALTGLANFAAYGAGIAVVVLSVSLGAALLKGVVAQSFRKFLPFVHRLSAIMLILAGAYITLGQLQSLPLVFGR